MKNTAHRQYRAVGAGLGMVSMPGSRCVLSDAGATIQWYVRGLLAGCRPLFALVRGPVHPLLARLTSLSRRQQPTGRHHATVMHHATGRHQNVLTRRGHHGRQRRGQPRTVRETPQSEQSRAPHHPTRVTGQARTDTAVRRPDASSPKTDRHSESPGLFG
ncbi:hypothetical protein [Candidatus Poriferisodalis sp.]|uniref:hypothetical protein n=1 Tax=Candidatus Poriferisodalis sp. TaxID=3101277 RepID=UPI003B02629F